VNVVDIGSFGWKKMFSQQWIIFVHHHGARESSHQLLGQLAACVFAMQFLIVTVTRDMSHGTADQTTIPIPGSNAIGAREGHGIILWFIWPRNPTYDSITPRHVRNENMLKETSGFAEFFAGFILPSSRLSEHRRHCL